jgi:hypothetical protein
LIGKEAYTLCFDRERRLWVATDAGLFEATAPYAHFVRVGAIPSARIWAVAEGSDGTLWAGGADGLFAFSGGRWRNFRRVDRLSNLDVLSLGVGADGTMWVGYYYGGGIDRVHLRPDGLAVEKGVQRPGSDGMIYFLDSDASGRIWAGTQHGVDVWDGFHWSHYGMGDGLVWSDCNLNGFAAEPDGTVWIGTSGGLSRFKPRSRHGPEAPLKVVFTRLAMGREWDSVSFPVGGGQPGLDRDHAKGVAVRRFGSGSLPAGGRSPGQQRSVERTRGGVRLPHSHSLVPFVVVLCGLRAGSFADRHGHRPIPDGGDEKKGARSPPADEGA